MRIIQYLGLTLITGALCQDVCLKISSIPEYNYMDLTVLQASVLYGSITDINISLSSGCDINYDGAKQTRVETKCDNPLLIRLGLTCEQEVTYTGYTALLLATIHGNTDIVQRLLEVPGIDVNAGSNYSSNPLFNAAQKGDLEMVKLLVEAGADINYTGGPNNAQVSVLAISVARGNGQIAQYLLSKGASELDLRQISTDALKNLPEDGGQLSDLVRAIQQKNTNLVLFLINNGADVNAKTDGYTPAYAATEVGDIPILKYLIAAGADLDIQSGNEQWTPLMKATYDGNFELMKFLLDSGADTEIRDADGKEAVQLGTRVGSAAIFLNARCKALGITCNFKF